MNIDLEVNITTFNVDLVLRIHRTTINNCKRWGICSTAYQYCTLDEKN